MPQIFEQKWVVGEFQCNCRLFACPKTGEGILVDPGDEAQRLIREVEGRVLPSGVPLSIKYLMHTHGHLDHIGATRGLRQALGPKTRIALHRADEPLYLALQQQGSLFGIQYEPPLAIDHYLEHEESFKIGELKLTVVHTPGHSPGSVCFRLHEDSSLGVHETLLTGDTLFQGSVGRTDLWGAQGDLMFKSIHERILTLDGDTRVCPGHGPDSRIGVEKRENPFLK